MEPLLGQIELFPYNFAPKGWLACTGQLLQINQNTALFSLLGTNFGGDGMTTFALPDLQGKAPLAGLTYYMAATNGIYPGRD
jgi:microcystin-dependent protein